LQWHDNDFKPMSVYVFVPEDCSSTIQAETVAIDTLLRRTGFQIATPVAAQPVSEIRIQLGPVEGTSDREGYHLSVRSDGVSITAPEPVGLFYGVQTLRQLIRQTHEGMPFIPCCEVTDRPAFPIRGFMHDLGRNPQDMDLLKRFVDVMAQYKMNTFHMHLSDRPGYRIESKAHPELNDPDNYRSTRRPGMYYTFDDLKDFVEYCRKHHVQVIPEIDMPGHSDYFTNTYGFDMQDPGGVEIVHDLLEEFCDHLDLPVIHIGSDEVHIRNETFIQGVYQLLRERGKKVVVWRPGGPIPGDDVITQLWSRSPKPLEGVQYLDSRANYVNHMDPFVGPVRVFMQQPCGVPKRSSHALGGILCHWPDNNVGDQMNIYRQSPVFPALLAYAERIWRGAMNNRTDAWAKLPPKGDPTFEEYAQFEEDMIDHRDRFLRDWPFPYVKQTGIRWRLIGPFPNQGDTTMHFPVEDEIQESYTMGEKTYHWKEADAMGGTIHLNHFFGFPAYLPATKEGTAYGLSYIHSSEDADIDFWIGFTGYSRSGGRRGGPNPDHGQWSHSNAKIWVNDAEIAPPQWIHPGLVKDSAEIPFQDEMFFIREPTKIRLNNGWNKVLVKVPRNNSVRKWMFTCVPIRKTDTHVCEAAGLRFTTQNFSEQSFPAR